MRRIAAHYIYWKELLPLHYIELDENGLFVGVSPLKEEIEATEFRDGIVYPALADAQDGIRSLSDLMNSGITETVQLGSRVILKSLYNI